MAASRRPVDPTEEEYEPSEREKVADAALLEGLKDKSGGVEVNLDDEEPDEPARPGQARPSRQDRRNERKTLLDEAERLRKESAEARATAAQAIGYAQGLSQARPQQPQEDQWAAHERGLQDELDNLVRESQLVEKHGTPEQVTALKRKAWDYDNRKAAFFAAKAQRGQPQYNPAGDPGLQLVARYPDVFTNEQAARWAISQYNVKMAEGLPNDWNTRDAVVDEARERFGMKAKRKDTTEPATRRRLEGMSKGGNGGNGEGPRTVKLTPVQVKEADAAFPGQPGRYQRYAKLMAKG